MGKKYEKHDGERCTWLQSKALRCMAMSKRTKERCRNPASSGKCVCKNHGGETLSGMDHPNTKHGRYIAHLSDKQLLAYVNGLTDERRLELDEEIALIGSRIDDLLSRVDSQGATQLWRDMTAQVDKLDAAMRDKKADEMIAAMIAAKATVRQGYSDVLKWQEIFSLIDQRRKLVESQRKRLVEQQQMIDVQQLMQILGFIMGSVRTHLMDSKKTDKEKYKAIRADYERLMPDNEIEVIEGEFE